MGKFDRLVVMRLHLSIAAFFLPLGLLFLVTGGLFILDFGGGSKEYVYPIEISLPLSPDKARLTTLAEQQLSLYGYSIPTSEPKLKQKKEPYYLEWKDLRFKATLKPTSDSRSAVLEVKELSWLSQLMQVHKSSAGMLFKIISFTWAIGLLVLFISGTYLALKVPKLRPTALLSLAIGSSVMVIVFLMG